jgi:thiol-disulfide isomerase/thioredoxin
MEASGETQNDQTASISFGGPEEKVQGTASRSVSAYRYLLYAALFMLLGISGLIFLGRERNKLVGQKVGELDFKPLLNTDESASLAMARGEYKLIHFWGTWCPPCMSEYPEVIKLQRKYKDDPRLVILSVSCGQSVPENLEELEFDTKYYLQGVGGDMPVYSDPVMYSRVQIANMIGRQGFLYPMTMLLDKEMKVVETWLGATRVGELDRAIERVLGSR